MFESMQSTFHSKLFWITTIFLLFYLYLKKVFYAYWKKHGVPQEDTIVPTGIFGIKFFMKKISLGNVIKNSYEKFKKYPYHGIYAFNNRILMVNDPELIKQILVKDFGNFCDRGLYYDPKLDPLGGHLFFLSGDPWRILRAKISPSFTSGKLKQMHPILKNVADNMIQVVDEALLKTDILEIKDIIVRYMTDTIFSLAFGLDSNCLKDPNNQFRHYCNLSVKTELFRTSLAFFAPRLLEVLRQPYTNTEVTKFFIQLFRDMVEKRKADSVSRKDFLDSLIELMEHEQTVIMDTDNSVNKTSKGKITKRLEVLEAAAQAFIFFLAGFETSSSTVTHCLYELALNLDVQEKVHEEIDELLSNTDDLAYDDLFQLEYLDMTFNEAMRKHPSVAHLYRVCLEDYKIPNSNYTIPKDMPIVISISGLHNDPDTYPEPENFDPTRFSKENIASRHPFTFLPFGEGPRICIGKRLGVLQSKIALVYMLKHYKFSICNKTPIPNEYSVDSIFQTPGTDIYLKVEWRKVH